MPLVVYREGRTIRIELKSGDRADFLKTPPMH